MAERRERDAPAPAPSCCLPWRSLVHGCVEALRRPAPAEVIAGRTTCLCGQTIERFGCGHSRHGPEEASLEPPSCAICLPAGGMPPGPAPERGDDKPPSPVYSSADVPGEGQPLVLPPPPPSRFVRAPARQGQDQASSSLSSVRDSGSSPSRFVHARVEKVRQDQPPSASSVQDSGVEERSSSVVTSSPPTQPSLNWDWMLSLNWDAAFVRS